MSSKERWDDPANDGQVDYRKVGKRFSNLVMLLVLAALLKMAIENHWLEQFYAIMRLLGLGSFVP